MKNIEVYLSPGEPYVAKRYLKVEVDPRVIEVYKEVALSVVDRAGCVFPNRPAISVCTTSEEDGLEVMFGVDLNPGRYPQNREIMGSEILLSFQNRTFVNQLTIFLDSPKPWLMGSYQTPASRYIEYYIPRDMYLQEITELMKERSEKGLFVPCSDIRVPRILSLPQ